MSTVASDFYVIGGTLRRDAPSYVRRQADDDLYNGVNAGQFCYVLTSRQMGKSSLMVRTAVRLRADGVSVAVLDLTALGQNVSAEQWYQGLLGLIGEQLNLEDELEDFWTANQQIGPLQRWMRAIREVVVTKHGRIVVFVDEIDAVRSLPFSTDEFFAGIREFHNRRTEDAEMERLTFCLLGVATPSNLIRDTRTTPFNIGRRIELTDFTELEAAPLAQGLERNESKASATLKRILYWTGGHPYLTQRLCQAVAEDGSVTNAGGVDRVCELLFLSARARERDDNLLFVRERLLKSEEADSASLLDLYLRVRRGRRVRDDETNPLVSVLRLSGVTRMMEGYLYVRNRIYYRVFDQAWAIANMPDAEVRRQRMAYRRGLLRAAAVAALILAVMGGLAVAAMRQRNRAVDEARRADRNAEDLKKTLADLQRALTETEMQRSVANEQRKKAQEQERVAVEEKQVADNEARRADLSAQELQKTLADLQSALAEAKTQRSLANELREKAQEQERVALEQKQVAEKQKAAADDALTHLGDVSGTQGDWTKAIDTYEQAYKLNPKIDDPNVFFNWGLAYVRSKQYANAVPKFEMAIELKIDNIAEAYFQLGRAYKITGRFPEAVEAYRKQLEMKADDDHAFWAYSDLGEIYSLELPNEQGALAAYKGAVRVKAKDHKAWFELGIAQHNVRKHIDAAESFQRAVMLEPDNSEYRLFLGREYLVLQRYNEAIETLNKAVELNPKLGEAYYYRGLSYKGLGQFEQAVESLNKGIEIGFERRTVEGIARYNLAALYFKLGNVAAARQQCDLLRSMGSDAPPDALGVCR